MARFETCIILFNPCLIFSYPLHSISGRTPLPPYSSSWSSLLGSLSSSLQPQSQQLSPAISLHILSSPMKKSLCSNSPIGSWPGHLASTGVVRFLVFNMLNTYADLLALLKVISLPEFLSNSPANTFIAIAFITCLELIFHALIYRSQHLGLYGVIRGGIWDGLCDCYGIFIDFVLRFVEMARVFGFRRRELVAQEADRNNVPLEPTQSRGASPQASDPPLPPYDVSTHYTNHAANLITTLV